MAELTIDDFANTGQIIYVATPYSKYAQGHALAHIHASKATAELQRRGIVALSPIAHSHPVALFGGIDKLDHEHWAYQNVPLMQVAAGCVVVKLPGWDESEGVRMEIAYFTEERKPVVYWEYTP